MWWDIFKLNILDVRRNCCFNTILDVLCGKLDKCPKISSIYWYSLTYGHCVYMFHRLRTVMLPFLKYVVNLSFSSDLLIGSNQIKSDQMKVKSAEIKSFMITYKNCLIWKINLSVHHIQFDSVFSELIRSTHIKFIILSDCLN